MNKSTKSINKKLMLYTFSFIIVLLIGLLLVYLYLNNKANYSPHNNIPSSKTKWIEDIDYLQTTLAKKHKNVYHTLTKEEYNEKFNKLREELPSLNDNEIKIRLSQIVASVGDAHTALKLGFNKDKLYPISFYWFGEDIRVSEINKDNENYLGYKLHSINDFPIDDIISKINSLISHENDQWLKVMNTQYLTSPDVLSSLEISTKDEVKFTLINNDGSTLDLNLTPSINIFDDKLTSLAELMHTKPIKLQNISEDPYANLYWYKYIEEENTLYFQYNACIDKTVAKRYGYEDYDTYPKFDEFSKELITAINNNKIDKFIIDLRNNTGGNSSLMADLAEKLSNIETLKKSDNIFVLIGRETFSSGVFACIDLKNCLSPIFIGEPTGGNVNGYGDIKFLTLPNLKLKVSYSTKLFTLSNMYDSNFMPNVNVEQSFDNYIKGIDDVYESVKNYK